MRTFVWLVACMIIAAACTTADTDDAVPAVAVVDAAVTAPPTDPAPTVATSLAPTTTAPLTSATTTAAPTTLTTTSTTEPPKRRLVIHGTGDVNVDPGYIPAFGSEGYGYAWSGLEGLFTRDDLTIINLECAISPLGRPAPKEFTFQCDPEAIPAMVDAGIDVANLANNHSRDFGVEAMLDSRINLAAGGIAPVGVGVDDTEAYLPAMFDVNGWRLAVIGMGGVVPNPDWIATAGTPGMSDGDTIEDMVAAVAAADEIADIVIVTVHWGVELDTLPRPEDVERADAMVAAGADIIFGHHSHRLQPLEWVGERPVAWGLGNFVWPRLSAAGSRTAVAEVVIEPDGTYYACLIPVEIVSSGHPVLAEPYEGPCMGDVRPTRWRRQH